MKNISSLLSCHCCGYEIINRNDNYYCTNIECSYNINHFLKTNDKLIFIDFRESVLKPDEIVKSNASSLVTRRESKNRIKLFFKKVLNGRPIVSKNNFKKINDLLNSNSELKILIIGGGTIGEGMDFVYSNYKDSILSFDVYSSNNVDFIADAHSIPLKSKVIDLVIIQAVLEHVFDPNRVVEECYRVLKDGGLIYAETPFLQGVHEGAYDFTRYTVLGHRILFKKFRELEVGNIGGVAVSLLWSIEYFFRGLFRSKIVGKIFKGLFSWLRLFEKIIPAEYNVDGACGSYFLGIKEDFIQDKKPFEYLTEYKGAQK